MTASPLTAIPLNAANLDRLGAAGVAVPTYDRAAVGTGIVHFGVGGFHRAHEAMYIDRLLNEGLAGEWGICGVGLLPADRRMLDVMRAQDCLYTLVTKASDGSTTCAVIGSIVSYLFAPDSPVAVLAALVSPEVRIVSLTVTEGGYNRHRVSGEFLADGPGIAADLADPGRPSTVFGFVVEALARRRAAGIAPFTVVSCDNVQDNGHVARAAFTGFARLRDPALAQWIQDNVAFPNSMVDRITPATQDTDRAALREDREITDGWPVVCEPFVQWVLQDRFGTGRPPLERAGVQLVDDVEPYELMKLRLLNAGHQAIGYAGYLAGYRYVHDAMNDPAFVTFLRGYMQDEGAPSLLPVPGIDLGDYIESLIERFGNPGVADTLARLCVDGSERIPKFLLPVLRHQLATHGPIDRCVAVIAYWARYAVGTDEQGQPIDVVDPARAELGAAANGDEMAFVNVRSVFGDLADDERFADSYRRAHRSLADVGARAFIATFSGHPNE